MIKKYQQGGEVDSNGFSQDTLIRNQQQLVDPFSEFEEQENNAITRDTVTSDTTMPKNDPFSEFETTEESQQKINNQQSSNYWSEDIVPLARALAPS